MPPKKKPKFKGIPRWSKGHHTKETEESNTNTAPPLNRNQAVSNDLCFPSTPSTSKAVQQENLERNNSHITASQRKLLGFGVESGESTCTDDGYGDEGTGYRIFHLDSLKQAFENFHNCPEGEVTVVEDNSKRYGLSVMLVVHCSKCKLETRLPTTKPTALSWRARDASDINRRVVYGACEIGVGREGIATICNILNMPPPVSTKAWNDHSNLLYDADITAIQHHLNSNRRRLRNQVAEDVPAEEIIDVAVTFDGTWSKRGHTANFGFAFIISVDTGQVLDYGFRSKICCECNAQRMEKDSEEYQQWYRSHKDNCAKNYEGSSGNMEVDIAKELWERSKQFGMRYKYMVSDGDSKAYVAVWDIYGCCELCEKYERMSRQSKEYQQWKQSHVHDKWMESHEQKSVNCHRVEKLD